MILVKIYLTLTVITLAMTIFWFLAAASEDRYAPMWAACMVALMIEVFFGVLGAIWWLL